MDLGLLRGDCQQIALEDSSIFRISTYGKCRVLLGHCGLLVVFGLFVLLLLRGQAVGNGSLVLCDRGQYMILV